MRLSWEENQRVPVYEDARGRDLEPAGLCGAGHDVHVHDFARILLCKGDLESESQEQKDKSCVFHVLIIMKKII